MSLKKILFTIPVAIIFLSGCDDKTSVDWYISNHKDMIEKYTECLSNHNFSPIDCQNAKSAMIREKNKPDVIAGYKSALEKVTSSQKEPVADLN